MAARKTKTLSQPWKDKIQASMLVNRLMDHVNGKIELSSTQVTSANILLKKVAPDLQSVAIGQDPELEPIKISWES